MQIENCEIKMIELSDNQLHGPLPRGLANCSKLEFLNFENNHIVDTFPSWMGMLPSLKVLVIHSNGFHGVIMERKTEDRFPMLCVIDESTNDLLGNLQSKYFDTWSTMKVINASDQTGYVMDSLYPSFLYLTG